MVGSEQILQRLQEAIASYETHKHRSVTTQSKKPCQHPHSCHSTVKKQKAPLMLLTEMIWVLSFKYHYPLASFSLSPSTDFYMRHHSFTTSG